MRGEGPAGLTGGLKPMTQQPLKWIYTLNFEKLEQARVVCSTPSLALTLKLWPELPLHTCSPL